MRTFSKSIREELNWHKNLRDLCRKRIKSLPKGTLSMDMKNGRKYYKICNNDSKRRVLASDPLVEQIKERRFLEIMERDANNNVILLQDMAAKYMDVDPFKIRRELPKAYQGVSDSVISSLGFLTLEEFHRKYQTDSQFHPENRRHTLSNGEKVRSRIELSIAEKYLAKGIEFVYEPLVHIGGEIVHPDFAVFIKSTGTVLFHEHVGNLSDEKYRQYFIWKMNLYVSNGILPFRDIVFTFENENGTLDMRRMEKMIGLFLE